LPGKLNEDEEEGNSQAATASFAFRPGKTIQQWVGFANNSDEKLELVVRGMSLNDAIS
jgi:hypothetical protein